MDISNPIPFRIRRIRRSRTLRVSVSVNGVTVSAPLIASRTRIDAFVREHESWIKEKLIEMETHKKRVPAPAAGQATYAACKSRAKKLITERVRAVNEYYKFEYNRITVKDLSSRWGSCSTKKNLNFHYRLMFLPLEIVDYVVAHELCHLQEMNHSRKFWGLVEKRIPEYKKRLRELHQYLP